MDSAAQSQHPAGSAIRPEEVVRIVETVIIMTGALYADLKPPYVDLGFSKKTEVQFPVCRLLECGGLSQTKLLVPRLRLYQGACRREQD